ncbi:hypothetical protein, variant [Aphanomyces invadans]|uniref:CWH43-like N-terminal domain-containing protein n=1 Tax=Aphanomyces invadans TaxID=157072 RepID=A0A024TGF7_9STRA|nr:hypothetical protein, variant [Aphanomyces invadans]ETV92681.1 hypothetical protein, variant [Aphanomyces invadans]|eukprot:XP_008878716.1 hypothetical protein, variant [Aphanomyces invadans]
MLRQLSGPCEASTRGSVGSVLSTTQFIRRTTFASASAKTHHATRPSPVAEAARTPAIPSSCALPVYIYPLLVPVAGLITMAATIGYSCTHQFTCSELYPTLSTAAKYHPQFHIFAVGMNITSYMIFLTVSLYSTFLLRTCSSSSWQRPLAWIYYAFGLLTCIGLSTLATFDLKRWELIHIAATVAFFVSSWVMMFLAQTSRWMLHYQKAAAVQAHRRALMWGNVWLGAGIALSVSCTCACWLRLWSHRWASWILLSFGPQTHRERVSHHVPHGSHVRTLFYRVPTAVHGHVGGRSR